MKIKEFYQNIGGNYDKALALFMADEMILMFVDKYKHDTSFANLVKAVEAQDVKGAFEGAHALKGVAGNLFFDKLYLAASALTEQLRPQNAAIDMDLYQVVRKEQEIIIAAMQELL